MNFSFPTYARTIAPAPTGNCIILTHTQLDGYVTRKITERKIAKYLSGYEKKQKFFTKHNDDIYIKLKPYLETAIARASKLGPFSFENTKTGVSEMHTIFIM